MASWEYSKKENIPIYYGIIHTIIISVRYDTDMGLQEYGDMEVKYGSDSDFGCR